MHRKSIAVVALSLFPLCAGAGPIELAQDLDGLDVTVTLAPRDNPDAMKIDNKTQKTISCSANFTGADYNRAETVTVKPGKSATIRIPHKPGGKTRNAELKCREKATDQQ
jgi:hypothetical protein